MGESMACFLAIAQIKANSAAKELKITNIKAKWAGIVMPEQLPKLTLLHFAQPEAQDAFQYCGGTQNYRSYALRVRLMLVV